MKLLRLAFLLCLAALPAAAQVNDTYVIPAAANTAGAFNTRWMTRFSVFNPQQYKLTVSIVFLPSNGGTGRERLFDVPANSVAFSDNILNSVFNTEGTGALLVATFPEDNPGVPDSVIDRSFLVTTDTFNNSSNGTFGQTISGTWTGLMDYEFDGISSIAHGIRNIAREGWRTNIGAVNLGRRSVNVLVTVYDADGRRILDRAPLTVPPLGHTQDRLPVEVDRGSVEFFVDDPSQEAVVFPYTSTIDQLSGDPTYQTPTLLASAGTLFGKGRATPQESLGTKINLGHARTVRAAAERLGSAHLVKAATGWEITAR